MNPIEQFEKDVGNSIHEMSQNEELKSITKNWLSYIATHKYSYNFRWMGRPIIQVPQDMVAMQELIWEVKPDLIIETGIAHGGSLIMNASLLALIDICDAIESGRSINPAISNRKVVGIDIDIRSHNREAIEKHPMASRIEMIEGSSVNPNVIDQVRHIRKDYQRVLVCLDSNHTHEHVLAELQAYAPLVSVDSYCVVFDTLVEDLPSHLFSDRPWGRGNNPKTAVAEYLATHPEFEVDTNIDHKLLITVAPNGWLRRLS